MENDIWPSEYKNYIPELTTAWVRGIVLRGMALEKHVHKYRLDFCIVWCTVPGCFLAWVLP